MPSIQVSVDMRFAKPLLYQRYVLLWFEGQLVRYPFFSGEAADAELCRLVLNRLKEFEAEGALIVDFRQVGVAQEHLANFVDAGLPGPSNGFDRWARDTIDAGGKVPLGDEAPPAPAEPEPVQPHQEANGQEQGEGHEPPHAEA